MQITTQHKLISLLMTMLLGLSLLSYFLVKHQNSSEYNIKTFYFGSLLPVSNLKEILLLLQGDVTLKVYENRTHPKNLESLAFHLRKTDKTIMALWKEYATRYKSNKEKAFVAHVDLKMQKLHRYLLELSLKVVKMRAKDTSISFKALSEGTAAIHKVIKELIDYELKLAQAMRKENLQSYENEKIVFFGIIIPILGLILILFVGISNSIKGTEKRLQVSAVELQRANQELRMASITDGLTNLFNRRYFDQIFYNEMLRAQREKLSFTFMMLDIDHFKKYNDFYGHAAGDEVIKKVSAHLGRYFKRPGDLIFRLGGEEFGIITVGTNEETALTMASSLVSEMKQLNIKHEKSETQAYVTLSMGMVHFPLAKAMEAKDLYELTDAQLYQAKEHGRHKVCHRIEA